jgi:hypothetical protein
MTILSDIGHVENPAARIKFLPIPQATPGQCGICGKGQDARGFADPGLDFEFWGTLIFCADCAGQIAAVFGFISVSDYEDILAERDTAQLELRETKGQLEKLRSVVDNLNSYWADIRPVSTGTMDNLESVPEKTGITEPVTESKPEPIQPVSGIKSTITKQHGATAEPSRKQGLLNL